MNTHDQLTEGKPSASGFDSCFRCLGKWALEHTPELMKAHEREKSSAASARGNEIHGALAKSDLSDLVASDSITASRCMYATGELVQQYDFEGASVFFEDSPDGDTRLARYWDSDDDFTPLWSAQLDELQVKDERALVIDYKTGYGIPQPIRSNWQVKAEGVAASDQWQTTGDIIVALVHPHHPDSLYETAVFTPEQIAANRETIRQNVAAIQEPGMPRTPNAVSCQFCRAKGVCPEFKAHNEQLGEALIAEAEDLGFTAVIRRTPEERAEHLSRIKMVVDSADALKEQYVKLLERDQTAVTGWGLAKKWDRSIKDEGAALEIVRKAFGDTAATHAIKFSLPALEAYLGTVGGGKKQAEEKVKATLNDLIKYKPSKQFLKERRA